MSETPISISESIQEPTLEPPIQQPASVTITTLVYLADGYLKTEELQKKIGIDINPKTKQILEKLIASKHDKFDEIDTNLTKIIKDGRIDFQDTPEFIKLIKIIYEIIYSFKTDRKTREVVTKELIKLFVQILILERKSIPEDKKTEFTILSDKLIDSSIDLISLNKSLKKPFFGLF